MTPLEQDLREKTTAEIFFDQVTREVYSVDASIFEVKPLAVVIPKTEQDLIEIAKISTKHRIPVTARGAATGITGGCLGEGIILDTSKYLNQIENIDIEKGTVTCGPGVIQDLLNLALLPFGYRLGPDTSTGDRATVAGMAANNAAGARSLFFGTMADAVHQVTLILSDGTKMKFSSCDQQSWEEKLRLENQEGEIYRTCERLRIQDHEEIKKQFPKIPRRASGYNLDRLLQPFPLNLSELIVGSEGTFGIISSMTLKIVPVLKNLSLVLIPFSSMEEAMKKVPDLLNHKPISLEMMDDKIMQAGMTSPSMRGKIEWLKTIPKVLIIAEFNQGPPSQLGTVIYDPQVMSQVWTLRKAGLGLLLSKRSYSRAIAFIEDLSIPPHSLAPFMMEFLSYLKAKGKEAGIYGHVGPGCLHIRPYVDVRSEQEIQEMKRMMEEITTLVLKFGGTLSGEHGDGFIRTWLQEKLYGKKITTAFKELKRAFDPNNLMNPHKVTDPVPLEKHLRKSATESPNTFLSFDQEGGLALAADLCNGNGACRKQEGIMCPSYQATLDEYDTTRARATVLRDILRTGKLSDEGLHDVLDLCLQCKGCKTECPSQVDMAKMKSEVLYHYQEAHGYSLRSTLFAYIYKINPLLFPFRHFYNQFIQSRLGKWFLHKSGISSKHPLPSFSKERFSSQLLRLNQPPGKPLVLLNDSYTEFYYPEIGLAAIQVLNRLGYHVTVPPYECCGRPAFSKGFLKTSQKLAEKLSCELKKFPSDIPIIGLEPSCTFMLVDEFHSLLPDFHYKVELFDTFLAKHQLTLSSKQTVLVHGHCYQRALIGMKDTLEVLNQIQGLSVLESPAGCCGMAGSFGYELEHVAISEKIGNLKLFPFLKKHPQATIIANGVSCRTQIESAGRKALHLAEFLARIN